MQLNPDLIEFIQQPEIKLLLAKNDFNKIYNELEYGDRVRADEITSLFISAGVNFLPYMSAIPIKCFQDLGIQQINIPGNCAEIGFSAFLNCGKLKEVKMEDGVKKIGSFAFENCISLKSITFPKSLRVVESGVFGNCTSLEDISIPDTVDSLGLATFKKCTGLKSARLPAGIHALPFRTFSGCSQLETVFIDRSYQLIDSCAFDKCEALNTIHYSGDMAEWRSVTIANNMNDALFLCKVKCSDGDLEWVGRGKGWVTVI